MSVKILGSYYLHDTIATTAASTRYRALVIGADGFEGFVLVDRLTEAFLRDDERRVELERLVGLLRQLEHPNLAGIRELTRIRDDSLLVRESLPGANLRSLMTRLQRTKTGLTVDEGLYVALEILRALEAAERFGHERGEVLVHGNVHPGSIFVGYGGEIQVIGLGLDRLLGESDPEALPYRSPEQLRGVANDPGSDVFGVAVMLFELLTGMPLFQGKTQEETIVRVNAGLTVAEAQEKGLERELSEFFSRALDPRRDFRFAGAAEAWAAIVNLAPRLDTAAAQQAFSERVRATFDTDIRREERRLDEAKAGLGLVGEELEVPPAPAPPAPAPAAPAPAVASEPAKAAPHWTDAALPVPAAATSAAPVSEVAAPPAAAPPTESPVPPPGAVAAPLVLATLPADFADAPVAAAPEAAPPRPIEERPAPPPRPVEKPVPPEPSEDRSKPKVDPWAAGRSKTAQAPAFAPSGRSTDEPPSGLIPHDQMHAMLGEIAKKSPHFQAAPKAAPPPTFTPSGKGTEEPPSGLIPSDQMHSMLGEIAKKKGHFQTAPKVTPPPTFVPSGRSTEEPPSGLIPSSEMHAMMHGAAPTVHRPHSEPRASTERTGPVQIRLPSKPPSSEPRATPEMETAPLRRIDERSAAPAVKAKKGCFGILAITLLPFLALTACLVLWT